MSKLTQESEVSLIDAALELVGVCQTPFAVIRVTLQLARNHPEYAMRYLDWLNQVADYTDHAPQTKEDQDTFIAHMVEVHRIEEEQDA